MTHLRTTQDWIDYYIREQGAQEVLFIGGPKHGKILKVPAGWQYYFDYEQECKYTMRRGVFIYTPDEQRASR